MADRDVMELIRFEKNLSIDIAIAAKKNCQLVKQFGEPLLIKAYTGVILMAMEFFNTGQQMSEMQAIQTASLLIEQYPAETIEDLVLCLKYVKSARYGKIFNRIDGQLIFEWFKLYLDEKYERFEQLKHSEKVNYQEPLSDAFLPVAGSLLSLSQVSKKESDNSSNRITHESHYQSFQEYLKRLTIIELKKIKDYYTKENSLTHFNQFQHYVDLIENQIRSLKNNKA